jgi:hypothetical protein
LSQEELLYYQRCTEPSLDELFEEFAVQLLMRRDGVTESEIRALLSEMKNAQAGANLPRKRETAGSGRVAQSSKAGKIPIRFI